MQPNKAMKRTGVARRLSPDRWAGIVSLDALIVGERSLIGFTKRRRSHAARDA
ncbi:hypothetical protein [Sorangium sp. So ce131]|uniref:hypothetical protein n=1 Tax=Sorangium sp. So ce131 TaxID=3133282 RepID=UPI003F604EFA